MYAYTYDVFNRLVAVRTTDTSPAEVAQYRYNGLGQRIAFRHDEDLDGDVDDEKWSNVVYDERWRMIAVYHEDDRDSGDAPKERFMYHAAGADGRGGSSYIDDTILRDRDHNTAWTSASDGTLERRDFYCQNWRADVVALVDSSAAIQEQVRYGLSGEPFLLSPADVTYSATNPSSGLGVPSGLVNNDDYFHYIDLWTAGTDPRADFNHDGTVNNDDFLLYGAKWSDDSAKAWGPGVLSNVRSRLGRGGEQSDAAIDALRHVRMRVFDSRSGNWLRRDPAGYAAGLSFYLGYNANQLAFTDFDGAAPCPTCGGGGLLTQVSPGVPPMPQWIEPSWIPDDGGEALRELLERCRSEPIDPDFQRLLDKPYVPGSEPGPSLPVDPGGPQIIGADPISDLARKAALCMAVGIAAYKVGEATSDWWVPPIDPTGYFPPRVNQQYDWKDACAQEVANQDRKCGRRGGPPSPEWSYPRDMVPGSRGYCARLRQNRENARLCLNARIQVRDCYRRNYGPDKTRYDHDTPIRDLRWRVDALTELYHEWGCVKYEEPEQDWLDYLLY